MNAKGMYNAYCGAVWGVCGVILARIFGRVQNGQMDLNRLFITAAA